MLMNIRNASIFLIFLSLLSSCSKDDNKPPEKVFAINGSLVHDGKTRTYMVHLPPSYYDNSNNLSLVLGFHGGGGSAENFQEQSKFNEKADAEGFVVVYPDGLGNPGLYIKTWNAGKCCGQNASTLNTDDVGFVSKLIDELVANYRIDSKKIYATGHSNGAMMCYRLANELSTKIAAIAPNAGNFQIKTPYTPTRNVPVIHVASKLDQNVQYTGGVGNGVASPYNPPVDSCLHVVAQRAACTQLKQLEGTFPLYTLYTWKSCNPTSFEVKLYLTEDGGHSWAGGTNGSMAGDQPSQAFVNNDIIWEFFSKHSLP